MTTLANFLSGWSGITAYAPGDFSFGFTETGNNNYDIGAGGNDEFHSSIGVDALVGKNGDDSFVIVQHSDPVWIGGGNGDDTVYIETGGTHEVSRDGETMFVGNIEMHNVEHVVFI